ncbi:MAG: hypothetical protein HY901_23670 [Deltaproteobacteria bacterium]|nr:hypothetical protein [Deltaproteobacteria bacterium]
MIDFNPLKMVEQAVEGVQEAVKSTVSSISSVADSFKSGDIGGGLQDIMKLVGNVPGGGGVESLMDFGSFLNPLAMRGFEAATQAGYASAAQAKTPEQKWANAVEQVKQNFDMLDTATGVGGKDGIIGRCDLEAALKDPELSAELREACRYLLRNPAAFNRLETAAGVGECDGFIGKSDVDAAAAALPRASSPVHAAEIAAGSPTGSNTSTGNATGTAAGSFDQQWASALDQVNKYFDLLDAAAGIGGKDGLIGRCDLEAAVNNPGLPKELREACRFLIQNPATFNQLETSAGVGACDGLIGKSDVEAARKALPKAAASSSVATGQNPADAPRSNSGTNVGGGGTTNGTAAAGSAQEDDEPSCTSTGTRPSTNRFEGMSAEEIVEALMSGMLEDLDDRILDTAFALERAQDDLNTAEKGSAAEKSATSSVTRLQMKLQNLVEKRSAMFNLLSNMMNVNHEMAKAAISNLGRS